MPNGPNKAGPLVNENTREWVIAALRPPYIIVRFALRSIYMGLFWWLDPLLQARDNASFENDIQANLYFLYSTGEIVKERWMTVHPFDFAVVKVLRGNIHFNFSRGLDQLNIKLSPRLCPRDSHELQVVIAALDATDVTPRMPARYLSDVAELLRPRMDRLDAAFSEDQYLEFKKKIGSVEAACDIVRREAQWELNRKLYS